MFSVEIRINGSMIVHIYGRNIGQGSAYSDPKNMDKTPYDYEYYEVEKGILEKGTVFHKRSKGIVPLITGILNQVQKNKKVKK